MRKAKSNWDKLRKSWLKVIDEVITDVSGSGYADVAAAFREYEAESLSECIIPRPGPRDKQELHLEYISFLAGWQAMAAKVVTSNAAAFGDWIQEHGIPTEYCDDSGESPALIIKMSVIEELKK